MKRLFIVVILLLLLTGCSKKTLEERVLDSDWDCDAYYCDMVVYIDGISTTVSFDRNTAIFGITPDNDLEFDYISYNYTSGGFMLYFYDSNPNITCTYEDDIVYCEDSITNETVDYLDQFFIELENTLE